MPKKLTALLLGSLLFGSLLVPQCMAAEPASPIPVLVELFTSEGCSSCPPADQLLRKIREQQPVQGVELITLGEHVDYWDYIGWKDPSAHSRFTLRQQAYAKFFQKDGPYTPQMVVDGAHEFVGSDGRALARAIAASAKLPKLPLRLTRNGQRLAIATDSGRAGTEVILAIVQHGVTSNVNRGENSGRKLTHDSVVRQWLPQGELKPAMEVALPDAIGDAAVVFVQDRASRRVLGAAMMSLR